MSGWGKLSFRGKLFSLILLIMAANVVVLLCMGSMFCLITALILAGKVF